MMVAAVIWEIYVALDIWMGDRLQVFNVTFNNMSVIL